MTQKLFSKNFTLLVLGQVSSLFGNFILKFALSMYVLEVTVSATILRGFWQWQQSQRFFYEHAFHLQGTARDFENATSGGDSQLFCDGQCDCWLALYRANNSRAGRWILRCGREHARLCGNFRECCRRCLNWKAGISRLPLVIATLGVFIIPAGVAFLLPTGSLVRYIVCVASFCGAQIVACVFSFFRFRAFSKKRQII